MDNRYTGKHSNPQNVEQTADRKPLAGADVNGELLSDLDKSLLFNVAQKGKKVDADPGLVSDKPVNGG